MRIFPSIKTIAVAMVVVLLFSGTVAADRAASTLVEAAPISDFEVSIEVEDSRFSASCPPKTSQHMWFYKPPTSVSLKKITKKNDIYVLTRDDESYLNQIGNAGEGPVLQYIKFDAISDACFQANKAQGTPCSCGTKPRANQVAWEASDICNIRDNHPDWFLRDKNGNLIYWNEFVMMDPGNAGWREFWTSRIKSYQAQYPKWGGVFMDNMSTGFGRHGDDFIELQKYPTTQSYQDAVVGFLSYAQNNYFKPNGKQMFANMAIRYGDTEPFLRYMDHMEGAMDEFWAYSRNGYYSVTEWTHRYDRISAAVKRGEKMLLVSQGSKTDYQRQLFGFASYLLLASPNTFYRYTSDSNGGYSELWLYDNYKARLGTPQGWATRSGNTWTRKFSNGKVIVNPETRQATIKVKGGC